MPEIIETPEGDVIIKHQRKGTDPEVYHLGTIRALYADLDIPVDALVTRVRSGEYHVEQLILRNQLPDWVPDEQLLLEAQELATTLWFAIPRDRQNKSLPPVYEAFSDKDKNHIAICYHGKKVGSILSQRKRKPPVIRPSSWEKIESRMRRRKTADILFFPFETWVKLRTKDPGNGDFWFNDYLRYMREAKQYFEYMGMSYTFREAKWEIGAKKIRALGRDPEEPSAWQMIAGELPMVDTHILEPVSLRVRAVPQPDEPTYVTISLVSSSPWDAQFVDSILLSHTNEKGQPIEGMCIYTPGATGNPVSGKIQDVVNNWVRKTGCSKVYRNNNLRFPYVCLECQRYLLSHAGEMERHAHAKRHAAVHLSGI